MPAVAVNRPQQFGKRFRLVNGRTAHRVVIDQCVLEVMGRITCSQSERHREAKHPARNLQTTLCSLEGTPALNGSDYLQQFGCLDIGNGLVAYALAQHLE